MKKCIHPLLQNRDQVEIQNKLKNAMSENNIDALIIVKPENIFYASGYRSVLAYSPAVPAGINMAVLTSEGNTHILLSSLEKEAANNQTADCVTVHTYPTWAFVDDGTKESVKEKPAVLNPFAAVKTAFEIVKDFKSDAVIGMEVGSIIVPMWKYINENLGDCTIVDSNNTIMHSRMIKTNWEINMLRYAAKHTEKSLHKLIKKVEPGMLTSDVDSMLVELGYKLDIEKSMISPMFIPAYGPYYGLSGLPRNYSLKKGDIIKMDGGFCHLGYMSDITRTFAVGNETGDNEKRIYHALYKGFEKGIEMLKPGVKYSDVFKEVRKTVEASDIIPSYPRGHVGHSIGVSPMLEEYPQLAPNVDEVLLPNMVVCLETSYFATGNAIVNAGFNIEDTFLITENGCERFTVVNNSLIYDL